MKKIKAMVYKKRFLRCVEIEALQGETLAQTAVRFLQQLGEGYSVVIGNIKMKYVNNNFVRIF